jgi:hypothetical protein
MERRPLCERREKTLERVINKTTSVASKMENVQLTLLPHYCCRQLPRIVQDSSVASLLRNDIRREGRGTVSAAAQRLCVLRSITAAALFRQSQRCHSERSEESRRCSVATLNPKGSHIYSTMAIRDKFDPFGVVHSMRNVRGYKYMTSSRSNPLPRHLSNFYSYV